MTLETSEKEGRRHNRRLAKKRVQWLIEALCFVSSSVLADSLVLRNPLLRQAPNRYASPKKTTRPTLNELKNERQNANASAKSKELHPNAQSQPNAAHLPLPLRTRQQLDSDNA